MNITCRENLEVQIYHHPHYQSLNEKLMNDFAKLNFYSHEENIHFTNIKGSQFNFLNENPILKPKGVTLIENWVKQIVQGENRRSFDFKFGTWASRLDKGQETLEHNHLHMCSFAFVYFVNSPKGASPLVFPTSGKKIKPEPGKLVLFPSSLLHKVPTNKCDNRVTIASNVTILERM